MFIMTRGASAGISSTMRSWLLGLQLWHVVNDATWHGSSHLKRTVQGSKSLAPLSSSRPKRAPMTIAHLLTLRNNLDLNNTFDAAVFGMATIAFWCQCHLTEVCVDASFDPHIHASRSSQQTSGTTSLGISFHSFWAPSTKISPKGEEIR